MERFIRSCFDNRSLIRFRRKTVSGAGERGRQMEKNILEYLEASAGKFPDKTAAADVNKACTYRELERDARRVGSCIAKRSMPRKPVAVLAEKSVDTLKVFMGCVYGGCFYVMLDPRQPAARLKQILDTLQPELLIADEGCRDESDQLDFAGMLLTYEEVFAEAEDRERLEEIRLQALDIDPLYTNFTSGSTGTPKGVVVSHRSVIDFIDCFTELFSITEQDVIGNQAPFDFDVSVKDIYSALKTGATLQIIPKQYFSFPVKLLDFLCEREVTTLIWAVSALCIITTLKGFTYRVPDQIKKVMFSGEVMPVKHLNLWKKYLPDAMYVNLYGPTEITCNCTYYIVDREFEKGDVLPMGQPFPNEKVILLTDEGQEVHPEDTGRLGELCVSGTALSLGYYRNPEQTAKVFVQNPLNREYLETIYRTGDLVYYNEKKELCFASRKDFQIKHMGHRIELGEIESAMEKVDSLVRSCCIFDEPKKKIVAVYEGEADKKEIVHTLGEILPAFMIPNVFCRVEHLPVTQNGKIDRKGLLKEYQEGTLKSR